MKKFLMLGLLPFLLDSCTVMKGVAPPYTNMDKICMINMGMTLSEVNGVLGIEPYNVLHSQKDGTAIYLYNYRIKDRRVILPESEIKRKELVRSEKFQTGGETWYQISPNSLYVVFKNGGVVGLYTDQGLDESNRITSYDLMVRKMIYNTNTTNQFIDSLAFEISKSKAVSDRATKVHLAKSSGGGGSATGIILGIVGVTGLIILLGSL